MDANPEAQSAFIDLLRLEIEQTQRLLDLLQQEYQLLQAAPSEALKKLQTEKKIQLEAVEKSATKHRQFLLKQGLTADRQGTETFIDDNTELLGAWKQYLTLLEKCQKQNDINGGAVELNQRQVNQALSILLGMGNANKTYGPSGESRPTNPSKSLGKA
ncbi:MAG: flagellar protein FlgN [Candidatus Thiodiazotropha sp. (ex Semelilucina semeliformis)]|nr:flagellar protein FlgN [Candidatus Thiodiazotropha sp. (ex Semelilucina semeliformis)]